MTGGSPLKRRRKIDEVLDEGVAAMDGCNFGSGNIIKAGPLYICI